MCLFTSIVLFVYSPARLRIRVRHYPSLVPPRRPVFPTLDRAASLAHSFGNRHSQTLLRAAYCTGENSSLSLNSNLYLLVLFINMLKERSRFDNRHTSEEDGRPSAKSRLPAIDELTLGLKQKLHLQARARAAPYYIRKQEPVDLVDRLLEQRALVAEAVRRLQEKKQTCHEISVDS